MNVEFDLIIRGGTVIDGTGADARRADVGVSGGKIAAIGGLPDAAAGKVLDASGSVVAPGFIDMHSHADCTILLFPGAESLLRQGFTTFVGGNCGSSPAPLEGQYLMQCWELDFWDELAPYTFYEDSPLPAGKVRAYMRGKLGYDMDWRSFGEFLGRVERTGIAANYIPLVGHGQIRAQVMGADHLRAATCSEVEAVAAGVREAMEAGAWGLSTGLDYAPGAYASHEELVRAASESAAYGGIYATHWRRTGIRRGNNRLPAKIDGIREAIAIGEESGARCEISHILSGYDITPDSGPGLDEAAARATLAPIDGAVERGLDISFDVIPNTSGGIDILPWLVQYFRPWVKQAGGVEQFMRNLRAADYRQYIKRSIDRGDWYLLSSEGQRGWPERLRVLRSAVPGRTGRSAAELGEEMGLGPVGTLFALLEEDPATLVGQEQFPAASVREFLRHPRALVGSDSFALDAVGVYGLQNPPYIMPHPNAYCAAVNFLTGYAPGGLVQAVQQLTGRPARWLGLERRGTLVDGSWADITVFTPDALRTNESFCEPRSFPSGIRHVLVNGSCAVEEGQSTSARTGAVLRRR